ncbi:hypothetical protein L596_030074 [Steinernema carpocapsae]|uniref:Uncharacterized protein n=1 Tax=Steinernema carpocapsae TaxID=34508 RepID=A0A4U5LRM7_STECR|nr:hypothetical protein L596_030074 [Steinernema carpocapsae]
MNTYKQVFHLACMQVWGMAGASKKRIEMLGFFGLLAIRRRRWKDVAGEGEALIGFGLVDVEEIGDVFIVLCW